jgi:preprotein translocase subunit YajC
MTWLALFAQGDPQQAAPSWSMWLPFLIMGLMLVLFFRTSAKQRRELQKALSALKKNDRVVTSGGILGTVVAVKDNEDEVTLKTDDASNTRIRVLKSSVVKILSDNQTATGETKPA